MPREVWCGEGRRGGLGEARRHVRHVGERRAGRVEGRRQEGLLVGGRGGGVGGRRGGRRGDAGGGEGGV